MEPTIVRRLAPVLFAVLLVLPSMASVGTAPAAAVAINPKVVLVVGATHATTPGYRAAMDQTYQTVRRYTTNVVRVYSPNATWSAVKAAMQGASIVVYMGHGNGYPNPYVSFARPEVQNGFGLNAAAGQGDYNNKYYGEQYIASEVKLAPSAVVILSHACYSAGNSEPGMAEPSLSVAKQRLDNFAAGFLKAGARAVIAEVYGSPDPYIVSLFTTHQTIEQIWRGAPTFNDNVFSFPSVRSPGYTAFGDPESRWSSFRRSLVGKPDLRSDDVTGARYARTDGTPGTLVVPGAAEVTAPAGAGLYPDAAMTPDAGTGLAPVTLPAGTKLRLLERAGSGADGSPVLRVRTFDGSQSGYVLGSGLSPRDSASPAIWAVDTGTGAFSPNGDGRGDTISITARASEAVAWRVDFSDGDGAVLASKSGSGEDISAGWDGLVDGTAVRDGTYGVTITAEDSWQNPPTSETAGVEVDTVAPVADVDEAPSPAQFSPNGDGLTDTTRLGLESTEAGTASVTVLGPGDATVASYTEAVTAGADAVTWDGRTNAGGYAPDGAYTLRIQVRDPAGNRSASHTVTSVVYAALAKVKSSVVAFFPQDGDTYGRTVAFNFTLRTTATVSWAIRDEAGTVVRTRLTDHSLPAGTYGFTWNGRNDAGAYVARGRYYSTVTATDGTYSVTQRSSVVADAFRISPSDTTPARGQRLTVTLYSAEPLKKNPTLAVTQPGYATWSVSTSRVSSGVYRATVTLRSGGSGTPLALRANGYDAASRYQWSRIYLALH
jgi:flagellar hook assembly protein FlgD